MHVARVVDLVGDDDHGLGRCTQQRRDLGVAGTKPSAGVDHVQDHVGVGDRLAGLMLDGARERVLGGEVHPAGVDQRDRKAVPLRIDLLAIAGHARHRSE